MFEENRKKLKANVGNVGNEERYHHIWENVVKSLCIIRWSFESKGEKKEETIFLKKWNSIM